jgi:hypothetical protein
MLDFHIGTWLKGTLEVVAGSTVLAAIVALVPPATALIGLVYWSIMLYRLFKEKKT